jgi:hypothetical protein
MLSRFATRFLPPDDGSIEHGPACVPYRVGLPMPVGDRVDNPTAERWLVHGVPGMGAGSASLFPPTAEGPGTVPYIYDEWRHASCFFALQRLVIAGVLVDRAPLVALEHAFLTPAQRRMHVHIEHHGPTTITILVGSAPGLARCHCAAIGPVPLRVSFDPMMSPNAKNFGCDVRSHRHPADEYVHPKNVPKLPTPRTFVVDARCLYCNAHTRVSTTLRVTRNSVDWPQAFEDGFAPRGEVYFGPWAIACAADLLHGAAPTLTPRGLELTAPCAVVYRLPFGPHERDTVHWPIDVVSLGVWNILRNMDGPHACLDTERVVLETSAGADGPWTFLTPSVPGARHRAPRRATAIAAGARAATTFGWERRTVRRGANGSLILVCEICRSETAVWSPRGTLKAPPLDASALATLLRWATEQTSALVNEDDEGDDGDDGDEDENEGDKCASEIESDRDLGSEDPDQEIDSTTDAAKRQRRG